VLKGQPPAAPLDRAFEITRSLPHGHAADRFQRLEPLPGQAAALPPARC
jgi:hypothetical protein